MGEVARWIRAKPGAAGSEGVPTFQRKVGISEYLPCKYSDSPRPSGTPLINAGGKILGSLTVYIPLPNWEGDFSVLRSYFQ